MQMQIGCVDLVSNTSFPALAAQELGFYKAESLDVKIELIAMLGATKALRNGSVDAIIAGSVYDVLTEFPQWKGVKVVVALSQGSPWLLVVRAIVKTQRALRAKPPLAAEVGQRLFPPEAAALIATIVERDLPFYDPVISEEAVTGLNRFAQSVGLLSGPVPYEQVVAVRFRDLWRS